MATPAGAVEACSAKARVQCEPRALLKESFNSASWPAKPGSGYAEPLDENPEQPGDDRKANAEALEEVDERPEPELVRAASFRT
jgi:hypothetical protein